MRTQRNSKHFDWLWRDQSLANQNVETAAQHRLIFVEGSGLGLFENSAVLTHTH